MITYLKRRFSSGDLQGELADKREQEGLPSFLRFGSSTTSGPPTQQSQHPNIPTQVQASGQNIMNRPQDVMQTHHGEMRSTNVVPNYEISGGTQSGSTMTANEYKQTQFRQGKGTYPSAPTSPSRGSSLSSSFMGPMGSLTGQISSTIMKSFSTAASTAQNITYGKGISLGKEHQKIVLIIDDSQTDWCKYFKGKKLAGEWDIKVEQAQFSEITMTAYSDQGCVVSIHHDQIRTKPLRSFKPDFVVLRQRTSSLNEDWQPILTGFMYGGTPCLNTLHAVYNMKNKPWLFAHLLLLRNRLGKENFPLIPQTYYTSHKEMVVAPAFPTIVKVRSSYRGEGKVFGRTKMKETHMLVIKKPYIQQTNGDYSKLPKCFIPPANKQLPVQLRQAIKIKADSSAVYQDLVSMLTSSNTYATTEPYVDANCDVHVQKIGSNYKAFMRKSISGSWKSNTGSALLEKVPMNDKFKLWIDEVSRLFGGLDVCSVDALQSKTGEYMIYEANGSDMTLYGESQDNDRYEIADLVVQRMQSLIQAHTANILPKAPSLQSISRVSEFEKPIGMSMGSTPSGPNALGSTPISTSSQIYSHQPPQTQSINTQHTMQSQTSYKFTPASGSQSSASPQFGGIMGSVSPALSSQSDHNFPPSTGSSSSSISSRIETPHQTGPTTPTIPTGRIHGTSTDNLDLGYRSSTTGTTQQSTTMVGSLSNQSWSQMSSTNFSSAPSTHPSDPNIRTNVFAQNSIGFDTQEQISRASGNKFMSTTYQPVFNSTTSPISSGMDKSNSLVGSKPVTQTTQLPERPTIPPRQTSLRTGVSTEDTDDTMKNLRKTFAGLFGDM